RPPVVAGQVALKAEFKVGADPLDLLVGEPAVRCWRRHHWRPAKQRLAVGSFQHRSPPSRPPLCVDRALSPVSPPPARRGRGGRSYAAHPFALVAKVEIELFLPRRQRLELNGAERHAGAMKVWRSLNARLC